MIYAHKAAGIVKSRNNGLAQRIRDALAKGPLTLLDLETELRIRRDRIRSSICDMSSRTGGVEAVPKSKPKKYQLVGWVKLTAKEKPSKGSGIWPAPKDYDAPFKPLRGPDPRMEHMKLAMETRR